MKMIKERWDKSASLAAWAVGRMDGRLATRNGSSLAALVRCAQTSAHSSQSGWYNPWAAERPPEASFGRGIVHKITKWVVQLYPPSRRLSYP